MLNEFSRTELLIGKESIEKLHKSKVAVFGIGGVGTFVVEGLVRAGVGKFVLVDDDSVCITNVNRQLIATRRTVGKPKVEVMQERILEINPKAEVKVYQKFYMPENAKELIYDDYDYIVDAIDTVTAKVDLIVRAKQKHIPVISSMGAGNKLNPALFEVADIYDTTVCPLAKVMRKELRARGVKALKVVYSREKPIKLIGNKINDCSENSTFDIDASKDITIDGTRKNTVRRQIPGSISFVPSVAGLIIAGEVVKDIIGYKTDGIW